MSKHLPMNYSSGKESTFPSSFKYENVKASLHSPSFPSSSYQKHLNFHTLSFFTSYSIRCALSILSIITLFFVAPTLHTICICMSTVYSMNNRSLRFLLLLKFHSRWVDVIGKVSILHPAGVLCNFGYYLWVFQISFQSVFFF